MIVAAVFQHLFAGMTLNYEEYGPDFIQSKNVTKFVQYGYGDSKELAKWIRGRTGKQKYPLIWCIVEPRKYSSINTIQTNVCFYLFTATKTNYYNPTRSKINYNNILEKLTDKIYHTILSNGHISLIYKDYETVYTTHDIPNYGLDFDDRDYVRKEEKAQRGVTIDIVDARKLDFIMRFDINCLTV